MLRKLFPLLNAFVLITIIKLVEANDELESSLSTFQVQATVGRDQDKSIVHLREQYSLEQSRGVVEFKWTKNKPVGADVNVFESNSKGVVFHDGKSSQTLLKSSNGFVCTDLKDLKSLMFTILSLEDVPVKGFEHVIGPARLLIHIRQQREKLQFVGQLPQSNRNLWTYSLHLTRKHGDQLVIYALYQKNEPQSEFPARVMVIGESFSEIDFSPIEKINEHNLRYHNDNNEIRFDSFALQPLSSCTKLLKPIQQDENPFRLPSNWKRFSFSGSMNVISASEQHNLDVPMLVAYDNNLRSMRVDVGKVVTSPLAIMSSLAGHSKLTQIFNFRLERRYSVLQQLNAASNKNDENRLFECMISRIELPKRDPSSPLSPTADEMLIGKGKFVYLGRALLRGVSVLVYEAQGTSPPCWLEQPVLNKVKPVGAANEGQYVTVIYLAETSTEWVNPFRRPLIIQVYHTTLDMAGLYGKRTINVYDFGWNLEVAPDDSPPGQLFSLEDHCPSSYDPNIDYAKFEMLLETDDKSLIANESQLDLLAQANLRNLAILASLQASLNIQSQVVYDLQTSLVNQIKGNKGVRDRQVLVSFNLATHLRDFAELEFQGAGDHVGARHSQCFKVPTFELCFLVAAHTKNFEPVYFGHEEFYSRCCIGSSLRKQHKEALDEQADFELSDEGEADVYRIRRVLDNLSVPSYDVARFERSETASDGNLSGRTLLVKLDQQAPINFAIKRVNVAQHRSLAVSSFSNIVSKQSLGSATISKLDGYALAADDDDKGSWPISATPLGSTFAAPFGKVDEGDNGGDLPANAAAGLTFEQCKLACTSDLSCKSFSVCVSNGRLECRASQVSFRSVELVSEVLARGQHIKFGNQFEVDLLDGPQESGATSVKLVRSLNCAIHNKNLMEFFNNFGPIFAPWADDYTVLAVSSIEECAEYCAEKNFATIKSHVAKQFIETSTASDETDAAEKVDAIVQKPPAKKLFGTIVRDRVCSRFSYVSAYSFQEQIREANSIGGRLRRELPQKPTRVKGDTYGYCELAMAPRDDFQKYNSNGVVHAQLYKFEYSLLYEKQSGFRLRASPQTELERAAYEIVVGGKSLGLTSEMELALRSQLERGDNFQYRTRADKSHCAYRCFEQAAPIWPACRSFDVSVERDEKTGRETTICQLNSLTLEQIVSLDRFDLIDSDENPNTQLWHFDPRPAFVTETSTLFGASSVLQLHSSNQFGQVVGKLIVALVGLCLGTLLGLMLADKLLVRVPRRGSLTTVKIINNLPDEDVVNGQL